MPATGIPRAVILDIGGVLEHTPDTGFDARWERRLGLQAGEFSERLRRSGLGEDADLGRVSAEEFETALGALYGLDRHVLDELLRDLWDWYAGELDTELAGYLQRLRPRYRTALLSNGSAGGRREEQARYGLDAMADLLVYSYEHGIAKPDPRIYRLTCERLGVRPEEAVFVDDLEVNVEAARALGMRAVLFRDTAEAIAEVERHLAAAR